MDHKDFFHDHCKYVHAEILLFCVFFCNKDTDELNLLHEFLHASLGQFYCRFVCHKHCISTFSSPPHCKPDSFPDEASSPTLKTFTTLELENLSHRRTSFLLLLPDNLPIEFIKRKRTLQNTGQINKY